jgi:hypothetical protein
MERTIKHRLRRFIQWIVISVKKIFRSKKITFPKKANNDELTAATIFLRILSDADSKLYYDRVTHECYLISGDLYLFLESGNLKIINSVYGYDIKLMHKMETYLSERFVTEMAKRRKSFKEKALSKVKHSLDQTLNNIIDNLKI